MRLVRTAANSNVFNTAYSALFVYAENISILQLGNLLSWQLDINMLENDV